MLTAFRNFSKSKWAGGLLVLVCLALLIGGGSQVDILGALEPPQVIKAGDRGLNPQEFNAELERLRKQQEQQQGRSVSFEELIADGGLPGYLRARAEELGFLNWAWNAGFRPSNDLVLRELRKEQAFIDPVTGQFSEDQYRSKLAEVNLTPAILEQQQRDQYAQMHFGAAAAAGIRLPRIYGAVVANQARQVRDGRWFVVTQQMAGVAPAPTDAQLQSAMSRDAARWRRPELRSGDLILFHNPADANIAISDEQVQARFNFRKDSLSVPERRSFVTLTAANKAAADRIAAALRAGQSPEAVASANNLQPAVYNDTPRSAISDPAVGAAVFALGADEVSAPVQARVGFVVAKVSTISQGREVTLADVRDQIVNELRAQEARGAMARRVEAYEAARREGKSVDDAVREVGAQLAPIPPITREGRNAAGQQVAPDIMLEPMWRLAEGRASEVISAGEGQFFVVRVNKISPAAMPTLDEVREPLIRNWQASENARLLNAKADELKARLARGEAIAAVAASVGAPVVSAAGVQQAEASVQQYGRGAVIGLFTTERGQAFSTPQTNDSFAVGQVTQIVAPTPALAAEDARQWQARFSQQSAQALFQSAVEAAATRTGARSDEALARQSLGLEAAPAPGRPAPAKK